MIIVDSSGWLEYLGNMPNAKYYASAIEDQNNLIVPTVCIEGVKYLSKR